MQRAKATLPDLLAVARHFETGMLVTTAPGGLVRSRPMTIARLDDDGTFWFVTGEDAGLLDDLKVTDRIALACMGTDRYLHLSGRLHVVRDPDTAKAVWSSRLDRWAPGGPDGETTLVLRLEPEQADFWDLHGARWLGFDRLLGEPAANRLREGHVSF